MSFCTKKIKTDECLETRDKGYEKCTDEKDKGYKNCCTWWPCSWACKAWTWVSNIVCVAWTWVSNIVCVLWKYVEIFICGAGKIVKWILNVIVSIILGLSFILEIIQGLLGYFPKKKLKIVVVIQRDEEGKLLIKDINVVYRYIQYLINVFSSEMNIAVLPASETSSDKNPLANYVIIDKDKSATDILDVCCDSCAAGDDLSTTGWLFDGKITNLGIINLSNATGYGFPIVAFAVRQYSDGKAGCSLGPLSNYVTVKFNENNNDSIVPSDELTAEKSLGPVSDLAHEVGHCCNLPHFDDNTNLMNPSPKRNGYLTLIQKSLVRASRHVTYL